MPQFQFLYTFVPFCNHRQGDWKDKKKVSIRLQQRLTLTNASTDTGSKIKDDDIMPVLLIVNKQCSTLTKLGLTMKLQRLVISLVEFLVIQLLTNIVLQIGSRRFLPIHDLASENKLQKFNIRDNQQVWVVKK